jgi:hypothetical protein
MEEAQGKYGGMLGAFVQSYSTQLLESTIHSFESHFQSVEGRSDELQTIITEYLRQSFVNGPSFESMK